MAVPTFSKMAPAIAHAPGLFESLPKGKELPLRKLEYEVGGRLIRFVGPHMGATELRVLQALVAIAGPQAWRIADGDGSVADPGDEAAQRSELVVATSYNEIARTCGYQANSGSSNTLIRAALERLFSLSVFLGRADMPQSLDFCAGHLFTHVASRDEGGLLHIEMNQLLAQAVLGGRGKYLRVSLEEVRKLKTDPARLLHHRLHWINPGEPRTVRVETLMGYIWPTAAVGSTLRTRRQIVHRAMDELAMQLLWSVVRAGDSYSVGRPVYSPTGSLPHGRRPPAAT